MARSYSSKSSAKTTAPSKERCFGSTPAGTRPRKGGIHQGLRSAGVGGGGVGGSSFNGAPGA